VAQSKEASTFGLQARNWTLWGFLEAARRMNLLSTLHPNYITHYTNIFSNLLIYLIDADQSKNEELRGCGMATGQHGQDLQEILPGPSQGRRKIRAKREGFYIHKTSFDSEDTIGLKLHIHVVVQRETKYSIFNKNGFVIYIRRIKVVIKPNVYTGVHEILENL
jgi:hypothetical protein